MKQFFILACVLSFNLYCKEIVRVGVYEFTPYVFMGDKPSGIAIEMLEKLNNYQSRYQFVPVATTSRRRYHDFENNKFDMMVFENINWGWRVYPVKASEAFVTDKEVYVTQASIGRSQSYFNNLNNKIMVGVLGYHYKFADFNSDIEYLKKHYDFVATHSQKQNLDLILKKRGDIALLSLSYLNYHFAKYPEHETSLLISEKPDQVYNHTILIRNGHSLTPDYMNRVLKGMKQKGLLVNLWQRYGLAEVY